MYRKTLTLAAIAATAHAIAVPDYLRARQEPIPVDTIYSVNGHLTDDPNTDGTQTMSPMSSGSMGTGGAVGGVGGAASATTTMSGSSASMSSMSSASSTMSTTGSASSATLTNTADTGHNQPLDYAIAYEDEYSPLPYSYNQEPTINSAAIETAASFAHTPASSIPGVTYAAQPVISPSLSQTEGPFTGPSPTVIGAVGKGPLNTSIPAPLPPVPNPYNPNGLLNNNETAPFTPHGGLGTNGSEPVYRVRSDFDYQSILLGLYQEWIELDLFHNIVARFNESDFEAAGLNASDRALIEFMANQESGHATLLSNLLGGPGGATPICQYNYPYETLREAMDFSQILTRWGESGVLGFQPHLDSRETAQLLGQSIHTEARQQQLFRQMMGLFPMPVWFETGIPQSWSWTYLAPYIASCPANSKRLVWQNFPEVTVLNQPNSEYWNATEALNTNITTGYGIAQLSTEPENEDQRCNAATGGRTETGYNCAPAISNNRSIPLSYPGRPVYLEWEKPGKPVGPNMSYITTSQAGDPKFVVWVSQLNVTYTPLTNITVGNETSTGMTLQPYLETYEGDPAINGTMFIGLTDVDTPYTPFNLSLINPHVNALGIYKAG